MKKLSMSNIVNLKKDLLWSIYSRQIIDIKRYMSSDLKRIDEVCHEEHFIKRINESSEKIKKVEETFNEMTKYYLNCVYNNNGYLFINKTKLKRERFDGHNVDLMAREFYKIYKNKNLNNYFFTTDNCDRHQIDSINKYIMGPSGSFKCQNNEIAMKFRIKLKIPDNENYANYCDMVLETFKNVCDERMKRKNNSECFTKVIEHSYRNFCKTLKDSTSLNLLSEIIEDDLIRKMSVKVYEEYGNLINTDNYNDAAETTAVINDIILKLVEKNEIEKRMMPNSDEPQKKIKKRRI